MLGCQHVERPLLAVEHAHDERFLREANGDIFAKLLRYFVEVHRASFYPLFFSVHYIPHKGTNGNVGHIRCAMLYLCQQRREVTCGNISCFIAPPRTRTKPTSSRRCFSPWLASRSKTVSST